jgi:hypothetical protein
MISDMTGFLSISRHLLAVVWDFVNRNLLLPLLSNGRKIVDMDENQAVVDRRICGWTLVVAALLSVAGMLHHPVAGGHGMAAVQNLAGMAGAANGVHGFLMVVLGALVFGFTGLTGQLGWRTPAARAAFVAYAMGVTAMLGAAVINGFAFTKVAAGLLARGTSDADLIDAIFSALGAISGTWAQVGVGAQAFAIALWALALRDRNRPLAILGAVASLPAFAAMFGLFALDVHGYLGVVVVQAVWTIAAGVALIRNSV